MIASAQLGANQQQVSAPGKRACAVASARSDIDSMHRTLVRSPPRNARTLSDAVVINGVKPTAENA
jgi:hypothetical protein